MTTATPARAGLEAYATATRTGQAQLVRSLRELLGARLVAYLAGVRETRTVHQWAAGERAIRHADAETRLRIAYQAALLITEKDTPAVAQSWFQGLNPQLEDRSPARLLRELEPSDAGPLVLAAARAFAAVG